MCTSQSMSIKNLDGERMYKGEQKKFGSAERNERRKNAVKEWTENSLFFSQMSREKAFKTVLTNYSVSSFYSPQALIHTPYGWIAHKKWRK